MESCSTITATATSPDHLRPTDVPSCNRNRKHALAPTWIGTRPNVFRHQAKPDQCASSRDFYLDAFFNPVWMSGPHVFSFAKDGTVVRPETYRATSHAGCWARVAACSGCGACDIALSVIITSSSTPAPSTPVSKAPGRSGKAWKNIAISEQDDAEFAAKEAQARVEAKGKLMGRVHTWPPKPLPAPCVGCEVLKASPRGMEVAWSSIGKDMEGILVSVLSHRNLGMGVGGAPGAHHIGRWSHWRQALELGGAGKPAKFAPLDMKEDG